MDAARGTEQFREADELFREGRFDEALSILVALNAKWPGTKNILLPMALCLDKLGRQNEALQTLRQLMQRFDDPRIRLAYEQIVQHTPTQLIPQSPGPPNIPAPPPLPEITHPAALPSPGARAHTGSGRHWRLALLIAAATLLIALAALLFISPGNGGAPATP